MGKITGSKAWRIAMTIILTTSLTIGLSAAPSSAAVVTHQVTNVGEKQFTVTWTSDAAEVGQVKWGTTAEGWDTNTADDDRGGATSDDTHHVTIASLTANTDYFYKIVSGGTTYDNGGAPYQVTTGPGLAFVIPDDIATGTVYLEDGTTPAEGAIVYVQITNATGTSQSLSALTEASGMWGVDITSIRADDFQAYYVDADADQMTLYAQGGAYGTDTATTTVGTTLAGAPNLVLALGPTVTDTVPADNAADAAIDTNIVATFSTDMDPTTTQNAFSILPDVAGAFSWATADEMTFNPTANLATDTVYTVTIADTAEDTEDKTMTADHVFSFSTEDTVIPADPTNVQSTSHTVDAWSTDNTIDVTWTDSVDPTPGTGLDGYSVLWDAIPATLPDTTIDIQEDVETLTSTELADGTWYLHMRAVDVAGNWQSTVHLGPFHIDTTAPAMETIAEAEGQYFNTAPTFTNFGFDDNMALDVMAYQMDAFDGTWTTLYDFDAGTMSTEWNDDGKTLPDFAGLEEGSHTIYFMATDMVANAAGDDGTWDWQFHKDTVAPPDPADVDSTSHTVSVESSDDTIVVTWTDAVDPGPASGLDGYSVEWSNASDTVPDTVIDIEDSIQTVTSDALAAGDWYFHLRTADVAGNWTATVHLGPFTIAAPLVVEFSAIPTTVDVGQTVTFTNLTIGGVAPLTYEWDFDGDEVVDSVLENPTYRYPTTGTYIVSLTVTDDESTSRTKTKADYITASAADIGPRVTNIADKSFTVTWISDAAEVGQVNWGTTAEALDQVATDDRGAETSDDTHHATITGLTAENTYYFKIVSGGVTYTQTDGSPYEITTGPGLEFSMPEDLIQGTVYHQDGTTPAEGAIVYLQIGTTSSQWLSAYTDVAGTWGIFITAIRYEDLHDYYPWVDTAPITLQADGSTDGSASETTTVGTAMDPGPPDMTLQIGPRVINMVPARNAENVLVDTNIVVTFSSGMNTASAEGAFSIAPVVAGTFTWDSSVMTFNPTANLATDTAYTVTISVAAEDTEDRPMTADHVWQFTTEDTVPPLGPTDVQSTSHTASDWSNDSTIDVTWTAATDPIPGTGLDGYGIVWDTNPATIPDTKNTDAAVTTTTSAALADGSSHYLHIRAVDETGNWGTTAHLGPFWVDATAPEVLSTVPDTDAETVPLDTAIVITFDDDMDQTLTEAAFSILPEITGTFSWGSPVLTFTPDDDFLYSTTYTVTVDVGATDKAGNTLAAEYTWSFTTPVLGRVDIIPVNPTVALGLTQQFTATGVRTDDTTIELIGADNWESSNTAKATIDAATGLATTVEQGSTVISTWADDPIAGRIYGRVTLTVGAPVLTGIRIGPVDPAIALGRTQQFAVAGVYSDASEADLTSLAIYTSSDEAVATINSAGLATSLTEGTTTVGTAYGAFTDETTLTVGPPVAVALVITPVNPRVALGTVTVLQFTATVHNSDGSTEDVTGEATWGSDDEGVAPIGLNTGLATVVGQGTATITATAAGLDPDGTTLTVTAPTLQSIEIDDVYPAVDGAALPVQAGNTLQLFLTGTYSDTSTADLTAGAVWSSSNRTVATVSAAGLVTAVSRGITTITASHSGERDTIDITVTEPPTVAASGGTDIGADSATLNGNLADMGSATAVDVSFEWGIISGALDQETTVQAMTSTGAFSAELTGLAADTDFYFRAKAVGDGTTYSAEQTFKTGTTPPTVTTGAATDVTGTTVTLNGSLDDLGSSSQVNVSFEWGLTTAYGNGAAATVPVMNDVGDFDAAISGLLPSTTYHYRAKGVGSLAYGADMTFTTATVLVSIAVTPEDSSVPDGMTRQYTATGTYSDSTTRVITADVTWSVIVINGGSATIDTDGLATGTGVGDVTIQAALDSVTGNTTLTVTVPVLTVIDVTPADPTIAAGTTQQFIATGIYSNGTTGANVTGIVTWSSSNTGVASINATGLATSYNEGSTIITATGSTTGIATLTVTAAELASIAVTPDGATIVHAGTQQYRAMGTYTDGSLVEVTNDPGITWASSNEGFATIDAAGLATSVAEGATVISASIGAVSSDDTAESATLNVTEAQLQSIAVTEAAPSVAAGKTYQFTATGTYSDTSTAILTGSVTWSSNNTAAAVVNAAGLATSYVPGTATITASLGGKTGQAILTVTAPELDNIVVTPAGPTITFVSGNPPTQQFRATGNYSDGSTVDLTTAVTWDSSNGGVATIGAGTGLATTTGDGTTTVTATHVTSGKSDNTTFTVLPDTVAPVVILTSPIKGMILSDKTLTVSGSVDDANVVTLVAIINGDTASPINLLPLVSNTFSQGVLLNTGSNSVLVRAVDGSGNTGTSRTVTVEVDPNKPAIMVTSPEGGTLTSNSAATVAGTITNAESATLILNGLRSTIDIEEDGTFSVDITLSEGTNVIVVNAYTTDHEGHGDYLGTSGVIQVILDTTPPVVTINSPTSRSIVNTAGVEVNGRIDDPGVTSALLILNGAAPQQIPVVGGTFSQNITLVPGVNNILVIATDAAGNTSPSTSPTMVDFDNTKPRVTITSPTNRAVVKVAGQTVTGTVEDPSITEATLLVNGTGQTISIAPDGSFNQTIILLEGNNTIEVTAVDAALNTGTSGGVSVTVDITPPVLTIGLSDPTDSITVTVTSDEPLQAIPTVTINPAVTMTQIGINQWRGTYGSAAAPIAAGDYTVTITGTDVAGNITTKAATFAKEQIDVDGIDPTTVTTETTTLEIETTGAIEDADISVTSHLENPSGNVGNPAGATQGAGAFLEIIASPELRDNLAQLYIRVDYNEEDLPSGTIESSLRLYVWDVATGVWKLVPGSGVNTEENYIYGTVAHLSEFGGFGRPTPAPTPLVPVPPPTVEPGVTDVIAKRTADGTFTETILALSDDEKVGITIGEGVTGLNAIGMPINEISAIPMGEPPIATTETNIIGLAYDIGPDGAQFDEAVTICFTYESTDIPAGVNEENLVIAFWDADAAAWVELDSITVNTTAHTICGQTTHFTTFAVFAHTSPASFTVSQLSVSPSAVNAGQQVSISVVVTNTGDLEGTYTVTLKVRDATTGFQQVTLAGGANQTVTFTTSKSTAGIYSVGVDGQSGRFTVRESLTPARFSVSSLTVSPTAVETGSQVTISILVSNTGDQQGSYDVQLKIDGQAVETQSITLTGGDSQTVTFTTTQDTAGTYSVTIATESGSFTVTKPAVVTPPEEEEEEVEEPTVVEPIEEEAPFVWWPYVIAAVVVLLGALVVVMRQM